MRIDLLRMLNFRCFVDRTIHLHVSSPESPGFTFFVAPNGGGKTTILDALAIALGSALLRVADLTQPEIRQQDARADILQVPGAEGGSVLKREPRHPVRLEASGRLAGESLTWARELRFADSKFSTIKEAANLSGALASLVERARRGDPVNLPLLAYYRTNRLWVPERPETPHREGPDSRFAAWRGCLDAGASWSETARWWERETLVALQKGTRPSLEAVRAVAGALYPGDFLPWFDLELADVVVPVDGELRPFSELSDGQRALLGLLSDLARRAADLNPHLGADAPRLTEGVVLIDEIDLHLHPSWQRRVVDLLRAAFPRVQFIVGTHAPQVLTDAQEGEIRVLRTRQRQQPEVVPVDLPRGLTADQILTGPWYELSSTLDDNTLALIRRQADLLRISEPDDEIRRERERIAEELRSRRTGWDDTSEERMVRGILAELRAEHAADTYEQRARLRRLVLERLKARAG